MRSRPCRRTTMTCWNCRVVLPRGGQVRNGIDPDCAGSEAGSERTPGAGPSADLERRSVVARSDRIFPDTSGESPTAAGRISRNTFPISTRDAPSRRPVCDPDTVAVCGAASSPSRGSVRRERFNGRCGDRPPLCRGPVNHHAGRHRAGFANASHGAGLVRDPGAGAA